MNSNFIQTVNTVLCCRDFEACREFYAEQIGWEIEAEKNGFIEFSVSSNARISLVDERIQAIPVTETRGLLVTFQVTKLRQLHERLTAAGIVTESIKNRWGAQSFLVSDPEGHRLEFWQPEPDQSIKD